MLHLLFEKCYHWKAGITKWGKRITKWGKIWDYKAGQDGITKWGSFLDYKVGQIDYKVGQGLHSGAVQKERFQEIFKCFQKILEGK